MNNSRYVKLLKEKLIIHTNIHHCTAFMHVGAPYHLLKAVKQFLAKNIFATEHRRRNSPDINPIENL